MPDPIIVSSGQTLSGTVLSGARENVAEIVQSGGTIIDQTIITQEVIDPGGRASTPQGCRPSSYKQGMP
jgi:hypothetical protein